eukprot:g78711.t1
MSSSSPSFEYEAVVVGGGMWGAACAKYLAQTMGKGVCVVEAGEAPLTLSPNSELRVFSSHNDQARITRIIDRDPFWAQAAATSQREYEAIEAESGVKFHYPVGFLRIGEKKTLDECAAVGQALSAPLTRLTLQDMQQRFPYLHLTGAVEGLFEGGWSGHIEPRAMVKAQLCLARKFGAHILHDTVVSVRPLPSPHTSSPLHPSSSSSPFPPPNPRLSSPPPTTTSQPRSPFSACSCCCPSLSSPASPPRPPPPPRGYVLTLASGRTLHTRHVILATGAFTNFWDLLPITEIDIVLNQKEITTRVPSRSSLMPLPFATEEETTRLVAKTQLATEVRPETAASAGPGCQPHLSGLTSCYILPPIMYPDGKMYIKIGAKNDPDVPADTLDDVNRYFRSGGTPAVANQLWLLLRSLMPCLVPDIEEGRGMSLLKRACVLCYTAHKRPMIGPVPLP